MPLTFQKILDRVDSSHYHCTQWGAKAAASYRYRKKHHFWSAKTQHNPCEDDVGLPKNYPKK